MRTEAITDAEAEVFLAESIRSRALERRLSNLPVSDAVAYIPYMFGTTYWGARVRPGWLWPCLHDEPYAHLPPFRDLFKRARGVLCNAPAESRLVDALFGEIDGPTITVGAGVAMPPDGNAERFRERNKISEPILLCVARKDAGKNVDGLLANVAAMQEEAAIPFRLVLIGAGSIPIPRTLGPHVLDLGFVDAQRKADANAAAAIVCVPSVNESFSLVLMEGWLAGRPALVNASCAVTSDHVLAASGGLTYDDGASFAGCVRYLLERPAIADRMGANGGAYVRQNYTWEHVIGRFRRALAV
jgi:glycosyltransferase involved in cell wall biosynthesis